MEKTWFETSSAFKAQMIGKLLGDGSITLQRGRKPRFNYIHTATDFEWSYYCYKQLSNFLPLNSPKYKKTEDPRLLQGYSESYYVQSRTSDIITYLRTKWYSTVGKVIPFDLIVKHFTKESLAWWYMDDGNFKSDGQLARKIILSSESFSGEENAELVSILREKFQLNFRRDNQNRILLYDQFQINYFLSLVGTYIHPSMYRKTINSYQYIFKTSANRTTIYLPKTINIESPTRNINMALKKLPYLISTYKSGMFYEEYFKSSGGNSGEIEMKSYQIIIKEENLNNLQLLRAMTGLSYSKIVVLCFI
ncbi:endonuclease [Virgibacillus kekensis]|uniref:Endonuclease n=1 Tax=Virgibacillus kekensis TaxID=202261 RepID=A0ABV9DFI6_9BACI